MSEDAPCRRVQAWVAAMERVLGAVGTAAVPRPILAPTLSEAASDASAALRALSEAIRGARTQRDDESFLAALRPVDAARGAATRALLDLAVAAIGHPAPPVDLADLRRDLWHSLVGDVEIASAAEAIERWAALAARRAARGGSDGR